MSRKQEASYITEKNPFAVNLKEIMERRRETQASLEARIKEGYEKGLYDQTISRQSISLYVTGQSTPKTETLTVLCRALDVSADYLLGIHKAENPFDDLHPFIKRNRGFFDLLLAAEDAAAKEGLSFDLMESIFKYVTFEKSEKLLACGNNGDLFLVDSADDALCDDQFEGLKSDYIEYLNADDFCKQMHLKNVERALDNFREFSLSHD